MTPVMVDRVACGCGGRRDCADCDGKGYHLTMTKRPDSAIRRKKRTGDRSNSSKACQPRGKS